MRTEQFTKHIKLEQTANGVELTFDDFELKDFVEDYLVEACDFKGDFYEQPGNNQFSLIL